MHRINKDSLKDFFKEPTYEKFNLFLQETIGETDNLDFKANWPEINKIVKIILGIANSGGGCIIIGVEENNNTFNPQGITGITYDPADFMKKIEKFFPQSVLPLIELLNFYYDSDVYGSLCNKKFQVIMIHTNNDVLLPIICASDGPPVCKGDIYIRRGTSTEKINYDELNMVIDKKVEAQYQKSYNSDLADELNHLKLLYDSIPATISKSGFSAFKQNPILLNFFNEQENKIYPEKSYEQFLVDMINYKSEKIKNMLR